MDFTNRYSQEENPFKVYKEFIKNERNDITEKNIVLAEIIRGLRWLYNEREYTERWMYSVASFLLLGDGVKNYVERVVDALGFKEAFSAHYDVIIPEESNYYGDKVEGYNDVLERMLNYRGRIENINELEQIWFDVLYKSRSLLSNLRYRIDSVIGQLSVFESFEERNFFDLALTFVIYLSSLEYLFVNGKPISEYMEEEYRNLIELAYPTINNGFAKKYSLSTYGKILREQDENRLLSLMLGISKKYLRFCDNTIKKEDKRKLSINFYVYKEEIIDNIKEIEKLLREYGEMLDDYNNLKISILWDIREKGLWSKYQEMKRDAWRNMIMRRYYKEKALM